MPLVQLIYASEATTPFSTSALRDLLTVARTNNTTLGVSGLLLYNHGSFFQVLEGEESVVQPLYAKIETDPRHRKIILFSKREIPERNFGDWSMGFLDIDQRKVNLPGFLRLLATKASYLDLQGDTALVERLIDGFHETGWREGVEF